MIKRVVNKPSKKVEKWPEFDESKIYVRDYSNISEIMQLIKAGASFFWVSLLGGRKHQDTYSSFINALHYRRSNYYILDNQEQLARFIIGCREFPKVEPVMVDELSEDEISIDDVKSKNIYAFLGQASHSIHLLIKNHVTMTYEFTNISGTDWYTGILNGNPVEVVLNALKDKQIIYQFDTQEEFLRWSLKQVTGKEFYPLRPGSMFPITTTHEVFG